MATDRYPPCSPHPCWNLHTLAKKTCPSHYHHITSAANVSPPSCSTPRWTLLTIWCRLNSASSRRRLALRRPVSGSACDCRGLHRSSHQQRPGDPVPPARWPRSLAIPVGLIFCERCDWHRVADSLRGRGRSQAAGSPSWVQMDSLGGGVDGSTWEASTTGWMHACILYEARS